jgi:hypothetical protein
VSVVSTIAASVPCPNTWPLYRAFAHFAISVAVEAIAPDAPVAVAADM